MEGSATVRATRAHNSARPVQGFMAIATALYLAALLHHALHRRELQRCGQAFRPSTQSLAHTTTLALLILIYSAMGRGPASSTPGTSSPLIVPGLLFLAARRRLRTRRTSPSRRKTSCGGVVWLVFAPSPAPSAPRASRTACAHRARVRGDLRHAHRGRSRARHRRGPMAHRRRGHRGGWPPPVAL